MAAVSVPDEQLLVPDTVKPALQVGWQVEPDAKLLVQSPAPPFDGAADASHDAAWHVAAVSDPDEQLLAPDAV